MACCRPWFGFGGRQPIKVRKPLAKRARDLEEGLEGQDAAECLLP